MKSCGAGFGSGVFKRGLTKRVGKDMRHRILFVGFAALLCIAAKPAFSDDLQDWEFNVNGTDYYPSGGATFGSVPGLDSSGFNSATGLGTFTLTFNPGAAGSYYIGAWFFDPVGVPFYNEYGAVNGSPAAGQSWQVDVPDYDSDSNHTGTIIGNLEAGTLNDTNEIPGTADNYLGDCPSSPATPASSCNDAVSMAQGFNFSLTANQEEVITLTLSSTNPGGFNLEDIHPIDGNNPSQAEVYYSASAVTEASCTVNCGPPPPIPEPASWSLFGTAIAFVTVGMRRRWAKG
jgi:hypothetical protein